MLKHFLLLKKTPVFSIRGKKNENLAIFLMKIYFFLFDMA